MPLRALIFDVDGTLADTERAGHLPACNENDYTFGESFAGAALVARSLEGFRLDQLAVLCVTPEARQET